VVALVSMAIYALFGFDGWLFRDDAIYLYAGPQFAGGVAPYVSIFDHKTPLASLLSGIFVSLGRLIELDDIFSVRLGWWLMSGPTGGFIFLLGRQLYSNAMAGILSALAFTGFWSFGREVVSGPHAKTPFVLFQVAFFYFAASRRWAWAGCAAALATWNWQPGVIYVIAAMVLPFFFGGGGRDVKIRGFVQAVTGILVPTVVLFGYFIFKGALVPLIDGSVVFNLVHLDRHPFDLLTRLIEPMTALFNGYTMMAIPAVLGFLYLLGQAHGVYHDEARRVREWPIWAPMMVTLPFFLLLTFLDFQGTDDLYPLLPYMAVGIAGICWRLSHGLASLHPVGWLQPQRVSILLAAVLALSSAILYTTTSENGLEAQRVSARQVAELFPDDRQVASIGLPELLVLNGQSNPNPYAFVFGGVDRKIMEEWPGGIVGFVRDLADSGVEVIGVGQTEGDHRDLLFETIELYYKKHRFGYFDVYYRTKLPDKSSDLLNN
jgi:hypothetical protein